MLCLEEVGNGAINKITSIIRNIDIEIARPRPNGCWLKEKSVGARLTNS